MFFIFFYFQKLELKWKIKLWNSQNLNTWIYIIILLVCSNFILIHISSSQPRYPSTLPLVRFSSTSLFRNQVRYSSTLSLKHLKESLTLKLTLFPGLTLPVKKKTTFLRLEISLYIVLNWNHFWDEAFFYFNLRINFYLFMADFSPSSW